ncbi:MAG: hypothetical protein RL378_294, partial [Actinomycetota bacterium]
RGESGKTIRADDEKRNESDEE